MNLEEYKLFFEKELDNFIEQMGEKGPLRDACGYALKSQGKRLRPLVVLMTADAIGSCNTMPAAMSVECFHAASLIADDLPSMDNDAFRRGRPSLHKAFGEGAAILASYTLIAAGYGGIYQNAKIMQQHPVFHATANQRAIACLESATRCAGMRGATQGQFLDLFPPDSSLETILDIMYKKTVTLFEISFLFGWFFGGGDLEKASSLQLCAYHLGMAFQIADDLEDLNQDAPKELAINIAAALGKEKAISLFEKEIALFEQTLKELRLWTESFQELCERLRRRQSLFAGEGFFNSSSL